ncbi:hypothetical protein FWC31_03595 [Candidatus Saccharibacteria bacterium]|nr:hypothetical protein [Candidatus Saccharibacteria bacterium]
MSEKRRSIKLDDAPSSDKDKLIGRDTIYIDTEDDITSIIEKVKESDSSILALVPPKRVGILQSVVNLKLLQRAAKSGRKKIALITTDTALVALAAGLRIPVARNLTTQPELPEAPDLDDTDIDIINGEEIAVGDLARVAEGPISRHDGGEDKEISAAVKAIETDDKIKNDADADGAPDNKPKKSPKSQRVPNFNAFRKKLLIFGSLGLALIIFLIWAIVFAPRGVITITAETTAKNVNVAVSLKPNAATNIDSKVIQPVIKQIKKTETINFAATGSKDVGEKAKGMVNIYVKAGPGGSLPMTLSAGTTLITNDSNKLRFELAESVTITLSSSCIVVISGTAYCSASGVSITAIDIGDKYNISTDTELSIAGKSSSTFAVASSGFTGGSRETVTVVSKSDLESVTEKLEAKVKTTQDEIEDELKTQMGESIIIVSGSFTQEYGNVISKPAVDERIGSDGNATATMEITYTLIGISKTDLKNLIEAQIGDLEDQKIYDNGIDKIQFKNFMVSDNNYNVAISTVVRIGLDLDKRENRIKENAVGKRSGEIASDVETIPGVNNVEVKFWPFWVSRAPAVNKLTVEFAVNE